MHLYIYHRTQWLAFSVHGRVNCVLYSRSIYILLIDGMRSVGCERALPHCTLSLCMASFTWVVMCVCVYVHPVAALQYSGALLQHSLRPAVLPQRQAPCNLRRFRENSCLQVQYYSLDHFLGLLLRGEKGAAILDTFWKDFLRL